MENKTRRLPMLLGTLLTLASLGFIIRWADFRTPIPPSLGEAAYFGPWHLLQVWWRHDPQATAILSGALTHRIGLWQNPWLAAAILVQSLLTIYLVRKT